MTARPLHMVWADQDPRVVHVRIFGDDGVLWPPPPNVLPAEAGEAPGRQGLAHRLAHSRFAADLRANADLIAVVLGLIVAGLLCATTPLLDVIRHLIGARP